MISCTHSLSLCVFISLYVWTWRVFLILFYFKFHGIRCVSIGNIFKSLKMKWESTRTIISFKLENQLVLVMMLLPPRLLLLYIHFVSVSKSVVARWHISIAIRKPSMCEYTTWHFDRRIIRLILEVLFVHMAFEHALNCLLAHSRFVSASLSLSLFFFSHPFGFHLPSNLT